MSKNLTISSFPSIVTEDSNGNIANINVGNLNLTGNAEAAYYLGNGYYLTGLNIPQGYSNANVANYLPTYTGNISGGNLALTDNISANIILVNNIGASGFLSGNAITGNNLNILTDANVGNGGTGNLTVFGNTTANYYLGNGAFLTGLPATYSNANVANYLPTYSGNLASLTGNVTTSANISANYILGNGAFITGLSAQYSNANVANYLPTYTGNILFGNLKSTNNITNEIRLTTGALPEIGTVITTDGVFVGSGVPFSNLSASIIKLEVQGGNISANNLNITNNVSANNLNLTSNVSANYVLGNGAFLTGLDFTNYSNANVANYLPVYGGNIAAGNISLTGNINTLNVTGAFTTNTSNTVGNAQVGNFTVRGDALVLGNLSIEGTLTTVNSNTITINDKSITLANNATTPAQANGAGIDINGANVTFQYDVISNSMVLSHTLQSSNLIVSQGNLDASGNINVTNNVFASGNVTASYFLGNGSQLTGLNFTNYSNANVANYLPTYTGNISAGNIIVTGNVISNTVGYLYGNTSQQDSIINVTHEPTGFPDPERTQSTLAFDNTTRTLYIAPTGANFSVWVRGQEFVVNTNSSITLANTSQTNYISYAANGALQISTSFFDFANIAPVSIVYYNAGVGNASYFGDERHGTTMDWQTHEYLHRTRGAAYTSGFVITANTAGTGDTNTDAQIGISSGTFYDEDIQIDVTASASPTVNTFQQDLTLPGKIPVFYRSGTAWIKDAATSYPFKFGSARTTYNLNTGGNWTTPDLPNGNYGVMFIVASNNLTYPVLSIMGQDSYSSLGAAEQLDWNELDLTGLPIAELRPLYRICFQTSNGYTNDVKTRIRSVLDIRVNESIQFVDSGTVTAQDIQFRETPQTVFDNDPTANAAWITWSNATVGNYLPTYTGNLSAGNANVTGNLNVTSNLNITNNAYFSSNTFTTGNANVTGNLNVTSNVYFLSNANISANLNLFGNLVANSNAFVVGNANISSNLIVLNNAYFSSNTFTTGNANVTGNLNITANARFSSNVIVTGYSNITGNINGLANLNITSNAYVNANVYLGNSTTNNVYTIINTANTANSGLLIQKNNTERWAVIADNSSIQGNLVIRGNGTTNVATFQSNAQAAFPGQLQIYGNITTIGLNTDYIIANGANATNQTVSFGLDQYSASEFRTSKYIVQVSANTGAVESREILVVNNGNTAVLTSYGIVYTGAGPLVSYDASIVGGSVLVTGAILSAATSVSLRVFPSYIRV